MKKLIFNFLLSGMLIFGTAGIAGAQDSQSSDTKTSSETPTETAPEPESSSESQPAAAKASAPQVDTTTTVINDTTTPVPDTAGLSENAEVQEKGGVSTGMIIAILVIAVVGGVVVYKLVSKKK